MNTTSILFAFGLLGAVSVALKLAGAINLSWWWVTAPFTVALVAIVPFFIWAIAGRQ